MDNDPKAAEPGTPEPTTADAMTVAARSGCAGVPAATEEDRAVVVHDGSTEAISDALVRAFEEIGVRTHVFNLDDLGPRPLAALPGKIAAALRRATVSALAATAIRGELSVRRSFLEIVAERRIRHAHMPAITQEVFTDGMAVDYRKVSAFMKNLEAILRGSTALTLSTPSGTQLEISYPEDPTIAMLDGIIRPEDWQNIPSGQIIVYPHGAEGVFVADRNVGDWFADKYDIPSHPVRLTFEGGFVRRVECDNKKLERDLGLFIRASQNSNRLAELVIGANLGSPRIT